MIRLIELSDIQEVKNLSAQAKEKDINPLIENAQNNEFRAFIGNKLYTQLLKDLSLTPELWEGGFYDNDKRYHSGLKRVLIECTYLYYLYQSGDTSTPFGMVNKKFEDGFKIDKEREKALHTRQRTVINNYWQEVKSFIFFDDNLRELYQGTDRGNKTFKSKIIKRNSWL